MNLPFYIAKRYLFAKKSHNVINIISSISAAGMAIGTAALIIILSVFNGFESLIEKSMSNIEPDILISPAKGKAFIPKNIGLDWAYKQKEIASMSSIIQENVYITYGDRNGLAKVKGVDEVYEEESPIRYHLTEGKFKLHQGDIPLAIIGAGLAYSMDISPKYLEGITLYYPNRKRHISITNPLTAINKTEVYPEGIFSINTAPDNDLIIIPLEVMRKLMNYTNEVSGIEIRFQKEISLHKQNKIIQTLKEKLGNDFIVKDRFMQNTSLYKMIRYEKISIFLILIFIIIIIAFNIFGSLAMLIMEKKKDIKILESMGAGKSMIKKIFILEGWMISLLGMFIGAILGIGFVILQQQTGIITMPGNMSYEAYPVILQAKDVIICCISIATIGYIIALMPVYQYYSKNKRLG